MTPVSLSDPSDLIDWKFTLAEQGFVARYGLLIQTPYKQYLPGGVELSQRHPPRRISQVMYDLAQRRYLQTLPQSATR